MRIVTFWLMLFSNGSLFCTFDAHSDALLSAQNQQQLLIDLVTLSSNDMAGRKPGTEGHVKAQQYIEKVFNESQLRTFSVSSQPSKTVNENNTPQASIDKVSYLHPFSFGGIFKEYHAANVIGYQLGSKWPEQYIVVTAHYDHLGQSGSKIYNGANDNASGVSALLSLIRYFEEFPPKHSIVFLATDAEESGLKGIKAFFKNLPISEDKIVLNVNLDMIVGTKENNTLFISGSRNRPIFKPMILKLNATNKSKSFNVKAGHDTFSRIGSKSLKARNWYKSSDHGEFKRRDIPFLYFGVDPQAHYHSPHDTYENIDISFFLQAVNVIYHAVVQLDSMALDKVKR